MAEYIYSKFKEECMTGASISGNNFRAVLVNRGGSGNTNLPGQNDASPEYNTGDVAVAVQGGAGGTPIVASITGTFTMGVFDASENTTTFAAVAASGGTAATADGILIYNDSHANKRLMCVIEIPTVTFTGGDVVVDWDDATSMNGQTGGIFAL